MQTIETRETRTYRHPRSERGGGMSHGYRWPGIYERRKNAKVSDRSDRNKFTRRTNERSQAKPASQLDLAPFPPQPQFPVECTIARREST